ncbi:MAG: hypothetical protein J5988_15075 [Eubacterium sp.]|nr:hypothetical protein [Eubacterium sp.]
MRLLIFGTTKEEQQRILTLNETVALEKVDFAEGIFTRDRVKEVQGYDGIWIMTNSSIGEPEAKVLKEAGVRYIISRATGIDHLDIKALEKYGLKAANVPSYSPNAISEHTILMLLSALRKMKRNQNMIARRDFGIQGICGREVRMMTVGVIGSGRIGSLTIQALKGLGAEVLVNAPVVNPAIEEIATYVSLDELLEKSDAILLHCPLTEENYQIISRESLEKCKDGVVLVNTARGGLVDAKSILEALKTGKVSSFAMDVYEGEDDFVRMDFHGKAMEDSVLEELLNREDVIYTAHVGFLTDQALYEIMRISLENAAEYEKKGCCQNEVTCRGEGK